MSPHRLLFLLQEHFILVRRSMNVTIRSVPMYTSIVFPEHQTWRALPPVYTARTQDPPHGDTSSLPPQVVTCHQTLVGSAIRLYKDHIPGCGSHRLCGVNGSRLSDRLSHGCPPSDHRTHRRGLSLPLSHDTSPGPAPSPGSLPVICRA